MFVIGERPEDETTTTTIGFRMVIVLLLAPPQLLLLLILLRGACSGCASRFAAHLCSISGPMASTHVLPRDVCFFVEGVGAEPWHIPLHPGHVRIVGIAGTRHSTGGAWSAHSRRIVGPPTAESTPCTVSICSS